MENESTTPIQNPMQMQQLYMEYQMLDQQVKQMEKQLQAVEMQSMELQGMMQNLDEFKTAKKGSNMLFQINPGMYSKGLLQETDELIISVGAGIAVTKTPDEAKEYLQKQLSEMQQLHGQIGQELRNTISKASQIEQQLAMKQ